MRQKIKLICLMNHLTNININRIHENVVGKSNRMDNMEQRMIYFDKKL